MPAPKMLTRDVSTVHCLLRAFRLRKIVPEMASLRQGGFSTCHLPRTQVQPGSLAAGECMGTGRLPLEALVI